MKIRIIAPEAAPLALLSLADPSAERVRRYLQSSTIFVGEEDGAAVAVAVLELRNAQAELKNIAVTEDRQGTGLGRQMLEHAVAYATQMGALRFVVGTGNSSLRELAFYQRNGFRIVGVIPGFFDDYIPPIVENGIACRDMVRLAIGLNAGQF